MKADNGKTGILDIAGLGRARLMWASLCAVAAAIAAIGLLGVSGWFLTGAAIAGAGGFATASAFNYLIPSALIRLMAIVRTLARYGERIVGHKVALEGMAEFRGGLFDKLSAQDSRRAPDTSPGEAAGRLIDDVQALEDLVIRQPARHAAIASALVSVLLVAFCGVLPALWLIAVMAALPVIFTKVSNRLTTAPAHDLAEALGDLRSGWIELAAARAEIAAYGLAPQAEAELAPLITRLNAARARLVRAEALQGALLSVYGALAVAGVLLLAPSGHAHAPMVALAMLATASAIEAMGGFSRSLLRRASLHAGIERLSMLHALEGTPEPTPEPATAAAITLGTHTFAPGSRVTLTGASGSGKTRVLDAFAGLHPAHVALALDGMALDRHTADGLRAQFALSPQDAAMLVGTIADNLRIARPGLTDAQMWQALDIAQLRQRVERMPAGLDTLLGESGGTLSGGERKRLSLARALLAGRAWLLLDEPTEGLDATTEGALVTALEAWLDATGTGLLLVSHRTAPLALCRESVAIESLSAD
ncbi:amino acid ABC transporter ATP-binding/permease protein [Novosphingobium sp. 9]|uniref:amino acid ABC transporter ATP-binding/permease protein n=1 Tax=Novosphingobium sp. 9 TaxID=2025349 RepID=UPI0021B6925D|nr:ATP-binding cassette domain-containing protein [Novosphingobium sp. 9]